MQVDETVLEELLEESQDIHTDAMRATRSDLDEFVEIGLERRARGEVEEEGTTQRSTLAAPRGSGLAALGVAAGLGAVVLALSAPVAGAATASDVDILRTAESIENLAVATYQVALTLPFIGGASANGVVKAFSKQTMAQHTDHAAAFAAAIRKLGGTPQKSADPVLLKVVDAAKPKLTSAGAVVALALELEDGAAQTYVANTSVLRNLNARKVTASIMGVEAQHAAILRAVQALLTAGDAKYIALPPSPLTGLPSAAGDVGFPNAFYPTSAARPETEGA
jgi:bacterioferritin (cytochrome b1)